MLGVISRQVWVPSDSRRWSAVISTATVAVNSYRPGLRRFKTGEACGCASDHVKDASSILARSTIYASAPVAPVRSRSSLSFSGVLACSLGGSLDVGYQHQPHKLKIVGSNPPGRPERIRHMEGWTPPPLGVSSVCAHFCRKLKQTRCLPLSADLLPASPSCVALSGAHEGEGRGLLCWCATSAGRMLLVIINRWSLVRVQPCSQGHVAQLAEQRSPERDFRRKPLPVPFAHQSFLWV